MPTDKDKRKASDLLAVSIRKQKSRRAEGEKKLNHYTHLVREMGSDLSLVLDMQELSRQKLARSLHDGLTQNVATLSMRVNYARRLMDTDPETAKLELLKIEELTRRTAKDIRHMIFILRRVDMESHGLEAELELMVDKMNELFDLDIHLSVEGEIVGGYSNFTQRVLYSMIEEGIDYSRRFAEASQIWVRLNEANPKMILLEFEDDGKVEDQDGRENSFRQLERMREYASLVNGSVKAESIEGKGSSIQVLIPVNMLATQEPPKGQ